MATLLRDDAGQKRLTRGQIDCLILVRQNLTSKQIAPILGISPHTVDQRVRQALHLLNVDNRSQAARVIARDLPDLPWHWPEGLTQDRVKQLLTAAEDALQTPLPIATEIRPVNNLSTGQRLLWILAIGLGAALGMCVYLAGLKSLGRLLANAP